MIDDYIEDTKATLQAASAISLRLLYMYNYNFHLQQQTLPFPVGLFTFVNKKLCDQVNLNIIHTIYTI